MSDSGAFLNVNFMNGTAFDFELPQGAFVWNTGENFLTQTCSLESSPSSPLGANEGEQNIIAKQSGTANIPLVGGGPIVNMSCYWTNTELQVRFGVAVSVITTPGAIPFTNNTQISWQYCLDDNVSGGNITWISPNQTATVQANLNTPDGPLSLSIQPVLSEGESINLSCTVDLNAQATGTLIIRKNPNAAQAKLPGMACIITANGVTAYFGDNPNALGPFCQQLGVAMKTNPREVARFLQEKLTDKAKDTAMDTLYDAFFKDTSGIIVDGKTVVPKESGEFPKSTGADAGDAGDEESVDDMLAEYGEELELLFAA